MIKMVAANEYRSGLQRFTRKKLFVSRLHLEDPGGQRPTLSRPIKRREDRRPNERHGLRQKEQAERDHPVAEVERKPAKSPTIKACPSGMRTTRDDGCGAQRT